jgi:hypothetical protein
MMGREKRRRKATTVVIQANTGIRISRIPLALMLNTVTMKLIAETSEASPSICSPSAQ